MISLIEFEAECKRLTSVEIDKLFLELSESDQLKWSDNYNRQFMDRLKVIKADSIVMDITNIAFSLRLLSEGRLWNSEPHRRLNGKPDSCYKNCLAMVNETSIYFGYALNKGRKEWYVNENGREQPTGKVDTIYGWISHAWLVTRDKRILETTSNTFLAYFGVPTDPYELWYLITSGIPQGSPMSDVPEEIAGVMGKRVKYDFHMPIKP